MALGEEIRDAPLRGALDSWKLKGAGLKEQADMEATDTKGQLERFKQILDYKDKMADNKRADDAAKVNETWRNARNQGSGSRQVGQGIRRSWQSDLLQSQRLASVGTLVRRPRQLHSRTMPRDLVMKVSE